METNIDSQQARNRSLNAQLNRLIASLDRQALAALQQREREISEALDVSVRLFSAALLACIVLLVLCHFAIRREIRWNIREKEECERLIAKLQESDARNRKLLHFRRNILQAITHELRTLLTAVCGSAELLQKDTAPADRERHMQTIRVSAGRMSSMTGELLEYFRLESRKEKLNIRPFKPGAVSATLETEFIPLAEAQRLAFITDNRSDEVLSGDKERILRIGGNLMSNALKFTRSGSILLSTEYHNGNFILSVQDTGTGIRKEMQKRIFAPFERLGNAVT